MGCFVFAGAVFAVGVEWDFCCEVWGAFDCDFFWGFYEEVSGDVVEDSSVEDVEGFDWDGDVCLSYAKVEDELSYCFFGDSSVAEGLE